MVFCNKVSWREKYEVEIVTILILIDGFLQLKAVFLILNSLTRHNPYFNRWFSAMLNQVKDNQSGISHNPYFNRWFSAIKIIRVD